MKKLIIIVLFLATLSIAGHYFYKANKNKDSASKQTVPHNQLEQKIEPQPQNNVKTYTMEEVRKHGPESWGEDEIDPQYATCWMVIHGKVYEIPDSFGETHPGGHAIYEGCGTDATMFFETRPQGSGKPHSENARSILEKFYIGELQK